MRRGGEDRLHRRLTELVAIPSITGEESDAVDAIARWLGDCKVEVDRWSTPMDDLARDPDYPGREVERETVHCVAAEVAGRRPGPVVALTGHVDTVPPGDVERWSRPPFGAEVASGHLYGLGACDMKSGIVALAVVIVTAWPASAHAGAPEQFGSCADLRSRIDAMKPYEELRLAPATFVCEEPINPRADGLRFNIPFGFRPMDKADGIGS